MQSEYSLAQLISELTKRVGKAEISARQFSLLCTDYSTRCKESKNPRKNALQYLKDWFTSYLAFRDEVMVIIQGAVYRAYHVQEHCPYSHERNAADNLKASGCESRFYVGNKLLSKCSVDGIKYLGHHHSKEKVGATISH